jgi:hypothetical protein
MTGLKPLHDYQARARAGRERFIADHPHPFLVRVGPPEPKSDNPWGDDLSFSTHVPGLEAEEEEDPTTTEIGWIIVPVKKREGGPFPERIGVGRARNCDVVLRFPTISKLHAQFRVGSPLELVDLGSANGTKLNGKPLPPRAPVPVGVGDRIELGAVELQLLDASALYTLLGGF